MARGKSRTAQGREGVEPQQNSETRESGHSGGAYGRVNGQMFTTEFLVEGIKDTPQWKAVPDADVATFVNAARTIFAQIPPGARENESVTEEHIIKPILGLLGWEDLLPQQNLSTWGREDVPDLLLFADGERLQSARRKKQDFERYPFGLAIEESKRWELPLDRADPTIPDPRAPSSQMLWYMRRAAVISNHQVRWGMLSNGRLWRLYWSDARSIAEDFLEIDLAAIVDAPGIQASLFDVPLGLRGHFQKVFYVLFRKDAFQKQSHGQENLTYHEFALREGRDWERRVADDLGRVV
jgi:hypothetical protein